MGTFLSILGIVLSFVLIKYRERAGDLIGEADWMQKVGGVYFVVVYIAIFIFIWSVAELTGTTGVLFAPLRYLIPGLRNQAPTTEF